MQQEETSAADNYSLRRKSPAVNDLHEYYIVYLALSGIEPLTQVQIYRLVRDTPSSAEAALSMPSSW